MARFLASVGYTRAKWEALRLLPHVAREAMAELGEVTRQGQRHEVRVTLYGPAGKSASVVTVWSVLANEWCPRFVTAYPA